MCTRQLPTLLAPRDAAGTGRAAPCLPRERAPSLLLVLSRMHVGVPDLAFISVEAFSTSAFDSTLLVHTDAGLLHFREISPESYLIWGPDVGIAESLR